MQLLHLGPEQDQGLRAGRVAEGAGLQVHPRLLPHGLPVGRQGGRGIAAEQELVVPVILAVLVLLQEVVSGDLLVDRPALVVLVADGPGLVTVGQPEFEHQLEQLGVGRLLHHPLALQPSGRLGRGKLLGLAAGGCRVRPALEAVRDPQDLPGLLVHARQVRQLVLQVPGKLIHVDHGLVGRAVQVPDLAVSWISSQPRVCRHGDPRPGLHQPVDDLLLHAVDGVLLVLDHVHVGVSQQLPIHAHTLLQDHGEHVGTIEGDLGRHHGRQAVLSDLRVFSRDLEAGGGDDGQDYLLKVLFFRGPFRAPAPGARPAVVPLRLVLRRLR